MLAAIAVALVGSALLANVASALPPQAEGRVVVDGHVWATFGLKDFPPAPEQSLDKIYAFDATLGLMNVAEAAPGDPDYNGGRWEVHPVTFAEGVSSWQPMSDQEILQAASEGKLSIGDPARYFECPLVTL